MRSFNSFLSALLESLLDPHNQLCAQPVTTTVEVAEIDVGTSHVAPGLSLRLQSCLCVHSLLLQFPFLVYGDRVRQFYLSHFSSL